MVDKKTKEKPKWVDFIDDRMGVLIKDAGEERAQWRDDVEEAFGFYNCDRTVIFPRSTLSKEARDEPDNDAQYHIPLLRQHVDSFVASTTNNDIKIRYVPKIDQQGLDVIARMGNALFDSYRTHIGWDNKIYALALHTALFGRGYIQLYIDEFQDWPEPRADIRLITPWQLYSTPGVAFNDSSEVVIQSWIDRDELKAQYPEFADDIDEVETAGKAKDRTEEARVARGGEGSPIWDNELPTYHGQTTNVSKNAVLVRERWKFDPSYKTYSTAKSEAEMDSEHNTIRMAVEAEDLSLLPQTPDMEIHDAQYHDDHSIGHMMFIDELRREMAQTAPQQNMYGIVGEVPLWSTNKLAVAEQGIALLMAHDDLHVDLSEGMDEWEIGKYPKYDGGWRHSVIIGSSDKPVGIYDGYSKYYDYGIKGVPIYEFNVQPTPFNLWTPTYACLMVDENKLLNKFMNHANDNYATFGGNHLWFETGLDQQKGFHFSTDLKEPSTFPPDTMFNMPGGKAGIIPSVPIPSDVYNMMGMVQSMAQQTSGVFGSMRGERQTGVRSGQHEQFLAQANRAQLDAFHRLWKNSLEELCVNLFKLMLSVPPDDSYVRPMLEGKAVEVDYEMLEDIGFAIEVVMSPGGASSTEERQSMLLGFTQNMTQHPLIMNDPQGLVLMFKFMAQAIKLQMPDMSEAMMNYANQLEQRAQSPEGQQAMQEQEAPPQGGQRNRQ